MAVIENIVCVCLYIYIYIYWFDVIFFISSAMANTAYDCENLKVKHPYLIPFTCQCVLVRNIQH